MSKLLFIKANPKPVELSVSLTVGQTFLGAYKNASPIHTVTELNLFDIFVPEIDGTMMSAWGELGKGKSFSDISTEQQKQLGASGEILSQFMNHDKYVFVTPLWNLMFPARLKSYIDALCVVGKTFEYTATGPVGLLKNKKALHIHSSGGVHGGAHADRYLRDILGFIGITDMESLIVEGHEQTPNKVDDIISHGKDLATQIGKQF